MSKPAAARGASVRDCDQKELVVTGRCEPLKQFEPMNLHAAVGLLNQLAAHGFWINSYVS